MLFCLCLRPQQRQTQEAVSAELDENSLYLVLVGLERIILLLD
jgi:hypothetical protein